jgi:hypothetical protein
LAVKEKSSIASESAASDFVSPKADSNFIYKPSPVTIASNKDQLAVASMDYTIKSPPKESKSLTPSLPTSNNSIIPAPGVYYDQRALEDVKSRQIEADFKQLQAKKEQALNQHFCASDGPR